VAVKAIARPRATAPGRASRRNACGATTDRHQPGGAHEARDRTEDHRRRVPVGAFAQLQAARGALKAIAAEDGTSLKRAEIAIGKAHGALAMGLGSRTIAKMAAERPHFVAAVTHAVGGSLIPVPGGVLVKDSTGALLGAVGVSGDTSDNDEIAALAGIEAAGCKGDPGA
jgi:uncharacterized protein GlcG (DUF336 family)